MIDHTLYPYAVVAIVVAIAAAVVGLAVIVWAVADLRRDRRTAAPVHRLPLAGTSQPSAAA